MDARNDPPRRAEGEAGFMETTHAKFREWVDLEAEGALGAEERSELDRHVTACAECAADRAALARLHEVLASSRVPVREGFRDAVMAALPAAGWEARPVRAWRLPLALMLLLGSAAAILLGSSAAAARSASFVAAAGTLLDLLGATVLAGAGLLSATWKGVGLFVGQTLAGSPLHVAVAAFGLVCLDVLVLRMIRRGRRRVAPAAARHGR